MPITFFRTIWRQLWSDQYFQMRVESFQCFWFSSPAQKLDMITKTHCENWTSTNNNDNNNKFLSIIHQWGCVLVSFQPVTLKASYLQILRGDSMDKVRFLQHPKEMMLPSDITCYWYIVFIIDLFTRFYLPCVGHVIILQRTVSFKIRLIHVHMHA